ncbi:MAG TPA: BON domain-containing protein [Bryobacteraceae bacterium]|nr:BON domain-containing protein [Bryobacteraceae bacterium]
MPTMVESRTDTERKVRMALERALGAAAGNIAIRTDGESVTLCGNVCTLEQWNLAEELTRGVPGVSKVKNYLSLGLFV